MWTHGVKLCLMLAVLGLSLPAFGGEDINLRQADGTKTPLGGVADAAKVTVVSGSTGTSVGGCIPTAAPPSYTEGVNDALSCLLNGALRIWMENLLAFEDETNHLAKVSGGDVRQTFLLGAVTGPTTQSNTTSGTQTLPVGKKTFQGVSSCSSGTCTLLIKIYGSWQNDTTYGEELCSLSLSATTTAHASCIVDTAWSFYWAVTSGSGGTSPLMLLAAMY